MISDENESVSMISDKNESVSMISDKNESVSMISDKNESVSTQEARAQLRESFLRAITELKGESCRILTYEQSTLEATFRAWKPDGSEIIVTDLKTPANVVITSALIRTSDILAVHFDKNINDG